MVNIDGYIAEYPCSFAEYDIPKVRETAGSLDGEIIGLLDELSRNGSEDSLEVHQKILAAIEKAREKHGNNVAGFYEAVYGCAMNESNGVSLEEMAVLGEPDGAA